MHHFCSWRVHGASHSAQIEALRERRAGVVSMLGLLVLGPPGL
jgi:hypothetical protein